MTVPPAFQKPDWPPPALLLSGPMPNGAVWCSTCVMIYMGQISSEVEFQQYAKQMHIQGWQAKASVISINLPDRDDMQLQPAVTIGASWKLPNGTPAMPVCWTHVVGIPPEGTASDAQQAIEQQQNQRSPLIVGKAYQPVRQQGDRT